jgi:hypothetical protein
MFVSLDCTATEKNGEGKQLKNSVALFNNVYFPVSLGYRWSYIIEKTGGEKNNYDVEVIKLVNADSESKIFLNSFPYFWLKEDEKILTIKDSGDIYFIDENDNKVLLIPKVSDIKEGYNWKMGEWNASIVSTNEKVTTKNLIYENCVHINYTISISFNSELWLAKDRGIVKWGFNRTNPPTLNFSYYVLDKFESK